MQQTPLHFHGSFQKLEFVYLQKQELLKCLLRVHNAHYRILDLCRSTFTKNVDNNFDIFGEGLVMTPKNRREGQFWGLLDPSNEESRVWA